MRDTKQVRVESSFFDDLDGQLGDTRGPKGEPSRSDSLSFDLLDIVEVFATQFDELPRPFVGRDDYRQLIGPGRMVYSYVVIGQLANDGAVELVEILLDLTGP